VPTEPQPTPWAFPDPRGVPDDLIASGADLEPGTVLGAYRCGYFPMPFDDRPGGEIGWWSPVTRGVLPLADLRVSRSLRRSCRRFEIRVDTAFEQVVAACADPHRPHGWISDDIRAAYLRLHELGWVHSVEAWRDGRLAGGLYGVAIGGLFAGESMFHRERDASKVALMGLVEILSDGEERLLDVQWRTDHLATLGVVEIPRSTYLEKMRAALGVPLPPAFC
jgi:leucyl/phenylalanyl-tRNA--protein transferase